MSIRLSVRYTACSMKIATGRLCRMARTGRKTLPTARRASGLEVAGTDEQTFQQTSLSGTRRLAGLRRRNATGYQSRGRPSSPCRVSRCRCCRGQRRHKAAFRHLGGLRCSLPIPALKSGSPPRAGCRTDSCSMLSAVRHFAASWPIAITLFGTSSLDSQCRNSTPDSRSRRLCNRLLKDTPGL